MESLDHYGLLHGTDKASSCHHYTAQYEQLIGPRRDEPLTLLELGYGGDDDPRQGGASARMWRDWLPHATIIVIDIFPKLTVPRGVQFRCGDQSDDEFIADLAAEFAPFDVIVDDASHLSSKTIRSFQLLFPHLASAGLYVIEDTHGAYHDWFYGSAEANRNPREPTSSGAPTTMQYLEALVDDVNFRTDGVLFPAEFWGGHLLEFVTFRFNLAVIKKA